MSAYAGRLPATNLVARHPQRTQSSRPHPYASTSRGSPTPGPSGSSQAWSNGLDDHVTPRIPTQNNYPVGVEPDSPSPAGTQGLTWANNNRLPGPATAPELSTGGAADQSLFDSFHASNGHFASSTQYPPHAPSATVSAPLPVRQASMSARSATLDLEHAVTRLKLGQHRSEIYSYAELPTDDKLVILFVHVLKIENMHATVTQRCTQIESRLDKIETLCAQAWRPSKAQLKLLRALIRHYLVKPLASYDRLVDTAKNYIKDNQEKFHLDVYDKDPIVRTTVNMHVNDLASQMKSAFRKAVFVSCQKRISLEAFTRNMLNNYHLPAIPAELPLSILGTFAMMRKIAEPLAKNPKGSRGGDTGFWRAVEAELDKLYAQPGQGKDRDKDEAWVQWAKQQISNDHKVFSTRRAARRSRRSAVSSDPDDNISVDLGLDNENNQDSGLPDPGTPPRDIPSMDDKDADMDEDEDPNAMRPLHLLGDIASTITIS